MKSEIKEKSSLNRIKTSSSQEEMSSFKEENKKKSKIEEIKKVYENKSKYSQDVRPPTFENHFENVCQTTPVVRSSEVNGKLRKKFYSQKSSKTLDICKRVLEKESPGKRKFSEFNKT